MKLIDKCKSIINDASSDKKGTIVKEYSIDELTKLIDGFVDRYRDPSIDGYIKFLVSFYSIFSLKNISKEYHTLRLYDRTDQLREYFKGVDANIYDLRQYKKEILKCCIDFDKPNHTPDYKNCISLEIMEFCIKQLEVLIPEKSKVRIPYCTIPSYILYNEKGYNYIPDYNGNKRYEEIGKVILKNMGDESHKFFTSAKTLVPKRFKGSQIQNDGKSIASILILPTIYGKELSDGKSEEDIINEELNKLNEHSGTLLVILPYEWLKKENKNRHKKLQQLPKKVVSLPYQVNDKPIAWLCFQKNNEAPTLLYNASKLKKDKVEKLLALVKTKGPEYKENEGLDPGTIVTFSIDEFTERFSYKLDNDKKSHHIIYPYQLSESYSSCDINLNDIDHKPSNNDKLHCLESDSFVIVKSKNTDKVRIGYIPPNLNYELYLEENDFVNFRIKKDDRIQKDYLLNKIFTTLKSTESSMETAFNAIRLADLPAIQQLENVLEMERTEKKESDKQYEAKIREEYEKYKTDVHTKKHNLSTPISQLTAAIATLESNIKNNEQNNDQNILKNVANLKFYGNIIAANIETFTEFEKIGEITDICLYQLVNEYILTTGYKYNYITQKWGSVEETCRETNIKFSYSALINILNNIYKNAADHGDLDKLEDKKGEIHYSIRSKDDKLVLEIKNNGKPISGEFNNGPDNTKKQINVENMFTKGATTKQEKDGHGLGCYSMKTCLEHKDEKGEAYGSIEVISKPNEEFKVIYVITFNKVKK